MVVGSLHRQHFQKSWDDELLIINTYMKQWSSKKYDEPVANYVKQTIKWKEILYGCKSKNSLSWLKVENSGE